MIFRPRLTYGIHISGIGFADPRCSQALQLLQQNPQQAMALAQQHPELGIFFQVKK